MFVLVVHTMDNGGVNTVFFPTPIHMSKQMSKGHNI